MFDTKTDFTIHAFRSLIKVYQKHEYEFILFRNYLQFNTLKKILSFRHDVDSRKANSLEFARIENNYGIDGTYYFRIVPQSFDEHLIKEIASLGHEIGYHYETMDTARGNVDKAYDEFCRNLEVFRKIVPIETICMHGSPLSKYDNRKLWEKYDYRSLGIKAEPYFDLDFNKIIYITDTGRRWDGDKVSIRDKAMASNPVSNLDFIRRRYRTTYDIIEAVEHDDFPEKAMMTFHPQRWTDKVVPWTKELVMQNVKNVGKRIVLRFKG